MNKLLQHRVPSVRKSIRVVDYCGGVFPALGSKSATKKAISAGRLFLNGEKAKTADFVKDGDLIELRGSLVRKVKKLDLDLPIIFEDAHFLVVNKPGGIAVNGNRYKTVENAVADLNRSNALPDALRRPMAAHRLDVPTSGLVLLAKTKSAQIKLNRIFQEKKIAKTYLAVVHEKPTGKGFIDTPIDGKKALTRYRVVRTVPSKLFGHLSLVKLYPVTGRTHQLRIHLKRIGHLIVGDKMYAEGKRTILGKGLLLCASSLQFRHPILNEEIDITIRPPQKFNRILDREADRFVKGRP